MAEPTRWVTETGPDHSQRYIERFRSMAAQGDDLDGEARLLDAMVTRHSKILDAGCGPGRVAGALAQVGHRVVGVDADPALIAAAKIDYPGPAYLVADLSEFDLATVDVTSLDAATQTAIHDTAPEIGSGKPVLFDAVVAAGNVLAFVAPGTEPAVMARIAAHLRPDGFVVTGFGTDRGYAISDFDAHCAATGLVLEHRFATWDLRPWHDDAPFAVSVHRKP